MNVKRVLSLITLASMAASLHTVAFAAKKDPEDCNPDVSDVEIRCEVDDGDKVAQGQRIAFRVSADLDCDCGKHKLRYRIADEDHFDDEDFGTAREYSHRVDFDGDDYTYVTVYAEAAAYYDGEYEDSGSTSMTLELNRSSKSTSSTNKDNVNNKPSSSSNKITITPSTSSSKNNNKTSVIAINGSSSTSTSSTNTKPATTNRSEVSKSTAVSDTTAAVKAGKRSITIQNAKSVSSDTLKAMADAAKKAGGSITLYADNVVNKQIQVRYYINCAKATKSLNLIASLDNASTRKTFETFYNNKFQIVSLGESDFGTATEIAAKVNLSALNTKSLKFYTYDSKTNKYSEIKNPNYSVDSAGFLHFTTTKGNDIIITDRALTRK